MSQPDDPERFADATHRSELGKLLASASRELPSDDQLARLAAQLGPLLHGVPGAPPASAGVSVLVKLGIAGGTLALLVGAGLTLRHSSNKAPASASRTVTEHTSTPALPAPPPALSSALPTADPEPSADTSSTPRVPDQPGAAASKSAPVKTQSEAGLLEQARRVLNSSPSSALLLANQHAARFPHGLLTQEREVIAIEALRRLHRSAEADLRAAAFARAFPGSAHQRMVDDATPKR
ncbi:MAG: hypothetical protein WDO74_28840 [Pseudomonadota bacterium]